MASPYVREVGRVTDLNLVPVTVGVDHDAVTVNAPGICQLSRDGVEELAQLLISAAFEAGDHAGRIASQL